MRTVRHVRELQALADGWRGRGRRIALVPTMGALHAAHLALVDEARRQADVVCELPGYLRGLCFVGPYALVGLSKIREKHIFGGLPIQQRHRVLRCGVAVVDLRSGNSVAMFEFTAGCEELYDVQFLPGKLRPTILNEQSEATLEAFTNPESSYWLRPGNEIPNNEVKDESAQDGANNEAAAGAAASKQPEQDPSATSQGAAPVAAPVEGVERADTKA